MQAHIMVCVDEKRALCTNATCKFDSVGHKLVGVMGLFKAQSVYRQHFHTSQIFHLLRLYSLHVRYISKPSEAVAEYRELAVHDPDGHDFDVANSHFLVRFYRMEPQIGHSGIFFFGKTIGNVVA